MSPPRAASADIASPRSVQDAGEIAATLNAYLDAHSDAALLEDGKALFELAKAQYRVTAEHDRCTLQMWSGERNLVRTVVSVTERRDSLRISTKRFGQTQPKSLVIVPAVQPREPNRRDAARQAYLRLVQRVLAREFHDW